MRGCIGDLEGGGVLEVDRVRQRDGPVRFENGLFGKTAVTGDGCDTVADFEVGDLAADGGNGAGDLEAWNKREVWCVLIPAFDQQKIREI